MKEDIHPEYHQAKVTCACGNSWTVGSTEEEIRVDVCSECHPFFTGKQKLVDTAGRVEKFKKKYNIEESTLEVLEDQEESEDEEESEEEEKDNQ